jgi:hypothetical protein
MLTAGPGGQPGAAVLRRGLVGTWGTDGHTVTVDGTELSAVTILAGVTVASGDVVAVLRSKSTVLILGKIVTPS